MAKKRINTPRRKRMSRQGRLQSGVQWLHKYKGKNTIRSYSKWYGVSEVCAILELRMLGLKIDCERLEKAKRTEENKAKLKVEIKSKKQERDHQERYEDSDETFYFIAGYTPGGFPYGVTWDEVDEEPPWKGKI